MAREQYPDAPREELRPASGRQRFSRHALVVGPEVDVEEIECLALSRFPGARWLATADDLAAGVLRHRVILSAAAEIEGRSVEQVIADIVEREDVPR